MEKWYHSIQDWHRFSDSVIDILSEYIKYSNEIESGDGIYVDEDDNVILTDIKSTPDEENFHPIVELLDLSQSPPEIKYDKVDELTDKYIFVR